MANPVSARRLNSASSALEFGKWALEFSKSKTLEFSKFGAQIQQVKTCWIQAHLGVQPVEIIEFRFFSKRPYMINGLLLKGLLWKKGDDPASALMRASRSSQIPSWKNGSLDRSMKVPPIRDRKVSLSNSYKRA